MTTIRIDSEVLQELQKRAVDEGLVFGSPNQVLRRVLGLDAHRDQVEGVEPMSPIQMKTQGDASVAGDRLEGVEPMSPTYNSTRLPSRRVTGKRLLREHPELPQDLRAYADRDGGFYEWPRSFPAVLFDNIGYIVFKDEASLQRRDPQYLTMYPDTRKVSIHDTISSIPRYVPCSHSHQ